MIEKAMIANSARPDVMEYISGIPTKRDRKTQNKMPALILNKYHARIAQLNTNSASLPGNASALSSSESSNGMTSQTVRPRDLSMMVNSALTA